MKTISIRSTLLQSLLALLWLPAIFSMAMAQAEEPMPAGPAGTEYYVAFMPNEQQGGVAPPKFMGLLVTSEFATRVEVAIPTGKNGVDIRSYDVIPGKITSITISREYEPQNSEEVQRGGIHVTSRAPVSLFALNSRYQSSGGYAVLPVTHWGKNYLPISLPSGNGSRTSQMLVVAAHDNTILTIRPNAQTWFHNRGQEITQVLQEGETYLIQAGPNSQGSDLSGSEIEASQPIGVVSGHVRGTLLTVEPLSESYWSSHQAAMLLPDERWGQEYYSVPERLDREDRYRVMAATDNTRLTMTHFVPGGSVETENVTLNRGEIFDSYTINGKNIRGPVRWSATGPILLMQLRLSGLYGDPIDAPLMIPLVAVEHYNSHSSFVTPNEIGGDIFPASSHTLTVIAKSSGDGAPLKEIMLDGTPLHTLAPEILSQRIGNDNLYYVRVKLNSGGHVITSNPGYPFTATVEGSNGNIARDFYAWSVPFWMPQMEADVIAPFVASSARNGNSIDATISDNRAPSYFSGVWSVRVIDGHNWKINGTVVAPNPDDALNVSFIPTADPSGPLMVELGDRDGNLDTVKLSDGICTRTAFADRNEVTIVSPVNELPKSQSVVLSANICGDAANVRRVDLGTGSAAQYLDTAYVGPAQNTPFTIGGNGNATVVLAIKSGTPQGTYTTKLKIIVDSWEIEIPVTITVQSASSVPVTGGSSNDLDLSLYPNPFTSSTTIALDRPLGASGRIVIADRIGRTVREMSGDAVRGETRIAWDGVDASGVNAPAGVYFITVADGTHRAVRSVTLTR